MPWDIERMCRLNGKKPTARERWTAFYRLWRMAHGNHGAEADIYASDCFRILFVDWSGIRLIESHVDDGGESNGQSLFPSGIWRSQRKDGSTGTMTSGKIATRSWRTRCGKPASK